MSKDIRSLLYEAEEYKKKFYYASAISYFKKIIELYPDHTLFACFQIGATYQAELGFGEEAKIYYLRAVEWNDSHPEFMKHRPDARKEIEKILASTYENLASLSDSYDEIYRWAEKLWEINPNDQILRENMESTKKAQSMSLPWSQTYYELAGLYWNADPSRDPGLHGFGASIYQRLLNNPGKFRLERQYYDGCAKGYCALMMLIVSNIGEQMEKMHGQLILKEFEFILEKPIEILEKYLSRHKDEKVTESLDFFYSVKKRAINVLKKGHISKSQGKRQSRNLRNVFNMIISVVFGFTLTIVISNNKGLGLTLKHYIIGGILGALIIFPILTIADKKNRKFKTSLNSHFGNTRRNTVAYCSKCGIKMPIITGPININRTDQIQGCFQCSKCGGYTCYDCSDASVPCNCGNLAWMEKIYIIN